MTSVSLVIASYRRPETLARTLDAVAKLADQPDELIVVARHDDEPTMAVARARAHVVPVDKPGVIAAMARGAAQATGDVVAFCDDDAEPQGTWISDIRRVFADASVGGFGGRDVIFDGELPRPTPLRDTVGVVRWWGRVVGNHHCGTGAPRAVHVLKGANCAYRRENLAFPIGLLGDGAEPHFEVSVGQFIRSQGLTIIYDPTHQVIHRPAPRVGDDQRSRPHARAIYASAFNVERSLPWAVATRRLLYVVVWGDRAYPGLLRLASRPTDRAMWARWLPSTRATVRAWWAARRPLAMQKVVQSEL